jgi:hypothetical protein
MKCSVLEIPESGEDDGSLERALDRSSEVVVKILNFRKKKKNIFFNRPLERDAEIFKFQIRTVGLFWPLERGRVARATC